MKMRAPQKREKRESGKSWRDYATDEDFDEEGNLISPDADVEGPAGEPGEEGESGVREWEGDEDAEADAEGGDSGVAEAEAEAEAGMDEEDEGGR
jgi:hypothetical protein